jgi:hypothetical protein
MFFVGSSMRNEEVELESVQFQVTLHLAKVKRHESSSPAFFIGCCPLVKGKNIFAVK